LALGQLLSSGLTLIELARFAHDWAKYYLYDLERIFNALQIDDNGVTAFGVAVRVVAHDTFSRSGRSTLQRALGITEKCVEDWWRSVSAGLKVSGTKALDDYRLRQLGRC
jgi:hypothetical protein